MRGALLKRPPVSLLPASLDMTDKDFDALRVRLVALVQSVFPDWTDFAVASFGNILLELYAFVGGVIRGAALDGRRTSAARQRSRGRGRRDPRRRTPRALGARR